MSSQYLPYLLLSTIIVTLLINSTQGRMNLIQSASVGSEGDLIIVHGCQRSHFNTTGICTAYCPKGLCIDNTIIRQIEETSFTSLQLVVSPQSKLPILLFMNGGSLKAHYCNDVSCSSTIKQTVRNSGTNDIFAVTIDSNETLHMAIGDFTPTIHYIKFNMKNGYYRSYKSNLIFSTIYDIDIQLDPNGLPIISSIQDSVQIITCPDANCYIWNILQQFGTPSNIDVLARTMIENQSEIYFQGCWSGLLVTSINPKNYTIDYSRQLVSESNQSCTIEANIIADQLTFLVGSQDPLKNISTVKYFRCSAKDCSESNTQSVILEYTDSTSSMTPQVTSTVQTTNQFTLFYQNTSSLYAVVCTDITCSQYTQYDLYAIATNPPVTAPVAPPIEPPVTPPVTPPAAPPVTPPIEPPIEPPVTPPVDSPVTPVAPPVDVPAQEPIEAPHAEPTASPILTPVTAEPVSSPSEIGPHSAPVTAPVAEKDTTIDWIIGGVVVSVVLIGLAILLAVKLRKRNRGDEFKRLLDEPEPTINSQSY